MPRNRDMDPVVQKRQLDASNLRRRWAEIQETVRRGDPPPSSSALLLLLSDSFLFFLEEERS